MYRLIHLAAVALLATASTHAQQGTGAGNVARPRTTETVDGVKLVGCVQPETRPNAFRLVIAQPGKDSTSARLPKGLKPGSTLELAARGETNLQPLANQKVEVTGKLAANNRRLEVVDARPLGVCEPAPK